MSAQNAKIKMKVTQICFHKIKNILIFFHDEFSASVASSFSIYSHFCVFVWIKKIDDFFSVLFAVCVLFCLHTDSFGYDSRLVRPG